MYSPWSGTAGATTTSHANRTMRDAGAGLHRDDRDETGLNVDLAAKKRTKTTRNESQFHHFGPTQGRQQVTTVFPRVFSKPNSPCTRSRCHPAHSRWGATPHTRGEYCAAMQTPSSHWSALPWLVAPTPLRPASNAQSLEFGVRQMAESAIGWRTEVSSH